MLYQKQRDLVTHLIGEVKKEVSRRLPRFWIDNKSSQLLQLIKKKDICVINQHRMLKGRGRQLSF